MPVLAQYDGYGKPYSTIPGAGLSEVVGITVRPELAGQRGMLSLQGDEQLPMTFTPRLGCQPPTLWSYAHQSVLSLAPKTHVVMRHYDGTPAITVHPFGKGKAIHLNMFTFEPLDEYGIDHFQRESLKQLLDNLTRLGGARPYLTVEEPRLYGQGLHDWAQYHYQLKDSQARVLALCSDRLARPTVAQIVLNEPVAEAFDILNRRQVLLDYRLGGQTIEVTDPFSFIKSRKAGVSAGRVFPVELSAGDLAFFAFLPYKSGPIGITSSANVFAVGKDPLRLIVTIQQSGGQPIPDSHPVEIEVTDSAGIAMPMLSRRITSPGRSEIVIPTRLGDPAGKWRAVARDCLTGREAETFVEARLSTPAALNIEINDDFYPSAHIGRTEVSDEEFCGLLDALAALYCNGGQQDRASLSFFTMDRDVGRHRIMQLLNQVDWREKVDVLRKHIEEGRSVILLGEDLGVDPATGLSVEPLSIAAGEGIDAAAGGGRLPTMDGSHKREAFSRLCGKDVCGESWPENRLLLRLGKGWLLLDRTSLDNQGSQNGQMRLNWQRWRGTRNAFYASDSPHQVRALSVEFHAQHHLLTTGWRLASGVREVRQQRMFVDTHRPPG